MFFSNGKKDKFSELLAQMTKNIQTTTKFFLDQAISNQHQLKVFYETIKEHEQIGNKIVDKMMKELNKVFITPIDREDIFQLAMHLDDVLDQIEICAALFEMYSITNPTDHMRKFVQRIQECSHELENAINHFSPKKLSSISPYSAKMKEIEENTNNLYRTAIKNLFATTKDPIKIIQHKDLYEALEKVVNDYRKVAKTLDCIIMKNA